MLCAAFPKAVSNCCSVLRDAGFAAHPVGGCVRDILLERVPQDWDVATSARPEQVQALFSHTVPTGIRHGTITVIEDGIGIEVTTFRREGEYGDARHPDTVIFDTDLFGDLSRRDFTINAMALAQDLSVIDPFGGQTDLEQKRVRAVGTPTVRFSEDALRILRGVRFAAQLGFEIEKNTADAMKKCAGLADHVSAERVKIEVEKILLSPHPQWIGELVELNVLDRFYTLWKPCDWNALAEVPAAPIDRWNAFCTLSGFPIEALPVERFIRMAILHPERERVRKLSLSGGDLQKLGLHGETIGIIQRKLAEHVLDFPEDNTPERLRLLLDAWDEV